MEPRETGVDMELVKRGDSEDGLRGTGPRGGQLNCEDEESSCGHTAKHGHPCQHQRTRADSRSENGGQAGQPLPQPRGRSGKHGNGQSWTVTAAVAQRFNLPVDGCNILANLAAAGSQLQDFSNVLESLVSTVTGAQDEEGGIFRVDSLHAIALRVEQSEDMVIGMEFVSLLNLVQFVAKLEAIWRALGLCSAAQVLDQEMENGRLEGFKCPKLDRWKTAGYKFAALAGVGEPTHVY